MPKHELTKTSKYSARQMFDMAVDVAAYREFLPLVRESEVFDASDDGNGVLKFKGRLRVRKSSLKIDESFVSDVVADEDNMTIVSTANDGPIENLVNAWKFTDMPDGGSQSEMVLEYEVSSLPMRMMIKASYAIVMDKLIEAFEKRADKLYG